MTIVQNNQFYKIDKPSSTTILSTSYYCKLVSALMQPSQEYISPGMPGTYVGPFYLFVVGLLICLLGLREWGDKSEPNSLFFLYSCSK